MPALFIGRFQPFHLGHLDAIQQAVKKTDMLFIGVGSSDDNYRPENPFTAGERIEMIKNALDEAKIAPAKYMIVPIPNIKNFELWPHHVEQSLPPFDTVYTSSDIVKILFENANKIRKNPHTIIWIQKKLNISSTNIRKAVIQNKKWEHMVPASVQKLLKNWGFRDRLKAVQEAEK